MRMDEGERMDMDAVCTRAYGLLVEEEEDKSVWYMSVVRRCRLLCACATDRVSKARARV